MKIFGFIVSVALMVVINKEVLGFSDSASLFGIIVGGGVYIISCIPKDNKQ